MVYTTVLGSYPCIGDAYKEWGLRCAIARLDNREATEANVRKAEREVLRKIVKEQVSAVSTRSRMTRSRGTTARATWQEPCTASKSAAWNGTSTRTPNTASRL
jgi:hypothetical protein